MTKPMKVCFLLRHSPSANSLAREALDMALAYAAFDQEVSLVFINDGVFQLQGQQHSDYKSLEKSLQALELYDIEQCYVCQQSINERSMSAEQCNIKVQVLTSDAIHQHISAADKVMSF